MSLPCYEKFVDRNLSPTIERRHGEVTGKLVSRGIWPLSNVYTASVRLGWEANVLVWSYFRFHAHTLKLYRAICSHGNHHAAHELTNYVDERQLMYCIKSKCTYDSPWTRFTKYPKIYRKTVVNFVVRLTRDSRDTRVFWSTVLDQSKKPLCQKQLDSFSRFGFCLLTTYYFNKEWLRFFHC